MRIQNQSDHQNTPGPDSESNLVIEEDENAHDSFQNIPLLDGIVMESEVEVFPGVRLVPLPPSLKKGTEIPRYISEWASAAGSIGYFFRKTQFIIDFSESSEFNAEQFLQALSLVCNSAVQIATIVPVRKGEDPRSTVPYTGRAPLLFTTGSY